MHYLYYPAHGSVVFESAGKFESVNHPVHPRRCLKSAVLLMGYTGEYRIAQDGREYALQPGTFMLLFPDHEHYGTAPAGDGQSHFWCHVQLTDGCTIQEHSALPQTECCILPEFGTLPQSDKYYILFHQLIDAAYTTDLPPALRQQICSSYASILLNSISAEIQSAYARPQQTVQVLAERIQQWIRLHYHEPITAQSVAEALQYHSDYLTLVMRSATGMTLSDAIRTARIREAKNLLLNSDMRVSDIACRVGFRDEKYFLKVFKKSESVTPSEYRQAHFHTHINHN